MKFNFKIQQYQTDAVDAVVNVLQGSRTAAACLISATPEP